MGHPCGDRLLVGHGPRWEALSVVDGSFVEQSRGRRWPVRPHSAMPRSGDGEWAELLEDFAGDVALEDADDLAGGLASARNVVLAWLV